MYCNNTDLWIDESKRSKKNVSFDYCCCCVFEHVDKFPFECTKNNKY